MLNRIVAVGLIALAAVFACNKATDADAKGRKLTLMIKADQTIAPGATDSVLVTISRTDFTGAVDIDFSDLPKGVTVSNPGLIGIDDSTKSFTLQAAPTAPLVNDQRVTVKAKGGGLSVSEGFSLTVKP